MSEKFKNRTEAGRLLAYELSDYKDRDDVIVLALPRGGVPVAFEVAKALGVSMDVFLVRKLGVPGQEELAMGAIASGGTRVLNDHIVRYLGISNELVEAVAGRELLELQRREQAFRGDRPSPKLENRIVILVDDGVATGSTMKAAAAAIRQQSPSRLIIAVPVASPDTYRELREHADKVIAVKRPEHFFAVGSWYEDFAQTSDDEVIRLLEKCRAQQTGGAAESPPDIGR